MTFDATHLVKRLLHNDESVMDDVVEWYSEDVLRLCYLLLWDRDEARDALQETLLRFIQRVKDGRFAGTNGSVKGFLLTCARNLCIDRLRKRKRFVDGLEDVENLSPDFRDTYTPDRAAADRQFQDAFQEALSTLSDAQRTVLVLFDVNGDSYAEIANALHISIGKVKSDLFRARRNLRERLQPFECER